VLTHCDWRLSARNNIHRREPEDRLQQAARDVACQGILITLGRPGGCLTLSAAIDIADRAEDLVMVNVVDATDMRCQDFNAHMAVGLRGGQVLTAAPTQGAASTLLGIEQELGPQSVFAAQVGQS
jgi:enolase